jgi:8-oxo-dGTP diphosphatase
VTIEAAGGVVWRPADNGVEILLIHRPAHGDWTLPKGKPHPPEEPHETALREVWEETGLHCRITSPAGMIHYVTGGEDKLVRYWAMRPTEGNFVPNLEVDEVLWLPTREAVDALTYRHDAELVASLDPDRWKHTSRVYLIRHSHAGDSSKWKGDDRVRPLSAKGFRQTAGITELLRFAGIERIVSSPYLRCMQTVEPLAEELGFKVEENQALAEGADTGSAEALLDEVSRTNAVLCSHGDIVPELLDRLLDRGVELIGGDVEDVKKGSIWILEAEDGEVMSGTYQPPVA